MKNSKWSRDDVKDWIYEYKKAQLEECGCEDMDNEPLYDEDYGASQTPGPVDADGSITPEELYQHFDVDQDGMVSREDYADHVAYHNENPEILEPYERRKGRAAQSARCPDSYKKAGDVLIQIPEDVVDMLKPLMQKFGVGCPASFAQAMADVMDLAMEHEVVYPFKVEADNGESWKQSCYDL